jgi:hypothetical protein
MSFSHSAYSVMGTNMAREVLKAKMMPNFAGKQSSRERVAAGNKRAKTSAWTANARLQVCLGLPTNVPSLLVLCT